MQSLRVGIAKSYRKIHFQHNIRQSEVGVGFNYIDAPQNVFFREAVGELRFIFNRLLENVFELQLARFLVIYDEPQKS